MWQLFQFPLCPFSRKVRLVLAEKGVGHELVRENPWEKRDEFIDLNPAGETPVMVEPDQGVTEFLPVSSTGHLILATELLGFDAEKWAAFNVIIQLGAILAIVVLYWRTFWAVLEGLLHGNAVSWRFVRNILIGFLPSAVLGFILIKHIEALLGNAYVVAVGFLVSFLVAIVVVRAFVHYISRHGFAPFAWYRIAAGIAALAWLTIGY